MKAAPEHAPRHQAPTAEDDAGTLLGDRKYRPDVEGLRAVAVVAVILFHTKIAGFTGGFVGVDVFYVISGFVITGVLLRKVEASDLSVSEISMLAGPDASCRQLVSFSL